MDLIYTGACRYCGQVASSIHSFETEELANEFATNACNCTDAIVERNRAASIQRAKATITRLCGEECKRCGFVPVDPETLDFLISLVDHIGRGLLGKAQCVLPVGDVVYIRALDAPGQMKISRKMVLKVEK